MNQQLAKHHRVVQSGSLDELRQALDRGVDVNAPGQLEKTALMVAIDAKELEKVKLLIEHGADPELTDKFNATSLRYAVSWDFTDGVKLLLGLGVDRGYHPKYALKQVDYVMEMPEVKLPDEMKGFLSEDEWKASVEETRNSMLELGRNPTVEPVISEVQSVEVLELFLQAGDDLNLAPTEVKREYLGLGNGGEFQCSIADYRKHKSPRYGSHNSERMDNPFWRDMIRIGSNAYSARTQFNDPAPFTKHGVVWCYDRFGTSLTELEDGRFVQIGGEHEDFYDPDFFIYNDVVIHNRQGEIEIYGYPKEVFPPTDFHSATLVGEWIYIIGCLGYPEQRQERRTPVFRLKVPSWEIEGVETSGEMPSWLHEHRSSYEKDRHVIRVDGGSRIAVGEDGDLELIPNAESFELDLSSFQWRKLM